MTIYEAIMNTKVFTIVLARSFFSYRDVEETDPLGSDDEADIIYKEEPEQEEEPSDKIEKVMHHRIGPKWRM